MVDFMNFRCDQVRRFNAFGCRTKDGDGSARYQDVAVCGVTQPVNHPFSNSGLRDQEAPLGIDHFYFGPGQGCNASSPGTGCIDDDLSFQRRFFACFAITEKNRTNPPMTDLEL